ncbi:MULTISPECIES: 1,4-alpha-glucan branching protein domain-containing protein [Nocardia]|uniref:1,4-alpha-glucan branching enzyme TTHA1902 n=2 Tax=Nocardia TaxID=1817 RepID=A0A449GHL2_NOCFR|nr:MULTISPECIES: glycoside hydrolase family 57 protein [Nocardia]MBF6141455.1 glycoside hydrolase family 57 protein [Nocardia farcinica]MBF6185255.1 glycoside hydrolase family 57 protein [Nocardia farcinica]MBF6311092.1 glycoside hydrolase family 57 protein [Nocardia farcinica]MBF6383247.1 glycoside hydrolase family 57 protein [Nocardia farcinica]MBF6407711.1 glycoside hydrolase family 57 protein [Nocardia farcinica]
MNSVSSQQVPGQFTLVLHSHLPWLAHHGRWPVGEEWLYQSWAASYLPVVEVLRTLAAEGRSHLLTLGITPVLAAQLDDPHCLAGMHHWLGNWQLRADEASAAGNVALGRHEHRLATAALAEFEQHWRHGAAPVWRSLVDAEVVELLGGPLAHPFQPLLHPRLRAFQLSEGLADARHRWGTRPTGIWAPECGYTPGMERGYAAAGVTHFMVDGPALRGDSSLGRPVHDSDVVAFGRDLHVSYRVWSPKSGYPGHAAYRDFHHYDHATGLKPSRVTGKTVAGPDKAPYDPELAAAAVAGDVEDFVRTVRARLIAESDRIGRPALVVAAFDTELFGHWWHEGPQWLAQVLRALPEAGVTVGTLADARARGFVGEPVPLADSSWGSGKDWRVWAGDQVRDLVELNDEVVGLALDTVDKMRAADPGAPALRDPVADQLLREAILTVSSDWAFMVSKDSAAGYARDRAHQHAHAVREIAAAVGAGQVAKARQLAARWSAADGFFPGVDARRLPDADAPPVPSADAPRPPAAGTPGPASEGLA